MIEIPRKVCLPKIKSQFKPDNDLTDVDEDNFIFKQFGQAIFKATSWTPGKRDDLIKFDRIKHSKDFQKVNIGKNVDDVTVTKINAIVTNFWDIFVPEGIKRPMLGFEFSIDTGSHTPVCCRKPHYGANESKVIMETIRTLKANDFIEECMQGGWGSPIVLAPKPHQEDVNDIKDLVWRMCVSYRNLNKVTNPFEFPIGRCDAAIEDIGDGSGKIYFISLDAAQGYHQIQVCRAHKHKLAFFAPDNKKYTYKVMPFGPRNAPTYYTAITRIIQDEATKLFRFLSTGQNIDLNSDMSKQPESVITTLPLTDDYNRSCSLMMLPKLAVDPEYTTKPDARVMEDKTVHMVPTEGGNTTVRQQMQNSERTHTTGSSVIIDDLLLRSTSKSLLLLLLECFCRVYLKYRVTLKISKCDFLKEKFEFVGHDVLPKGNTTASSKYDRIDNWSLPTSADGLHSFVALCNFYNRFLPLFELKVAPLRQLYMKYLHRDIPKEEWTQERKLLFQSLKQDLTSAPVLARYDSTKPVVLKTDWSSLGLSFILMQPADDEVSKKASEKLCAGHGCDFDLAMTGPRLQPFHCGMRACRGTEQHYHSFVGESAALRWAIAKNKNYLWGSRFYCLCDMKSLDKLLEYDGPIHCLRRWAQDLQSYDFVPYHRPARMMADVDALNRGPYAAVLTTYILGTKSTKALDSIENPDAYKDETFTTVMEKGKYNLKSINSFKVTDAYTERVSRMLTRLYDAQRSGTKSDRTENSRRYKEVNRHVISITNTNKNENTNTITNENTNSNTNSDKVIYGEATKASITNTNANTTNSHANTITKTNDSETSKVNSTTEATITPNAIKSGTALNIYMHTHRDTSCTKSSANTDLIDTFQHLVPSRTVNVARASQTKCQSYEEERRTEYPTTRIRFSTTKPNIIERSQTLFSTDKSAVDTYIEKHLLRWLFVGNGIPTITHHISELLPRSADITIVSSDICNLHLSKHLIPSATRVYSTLHNLLSTMISKPYCHQKSTRFCLHGIQFGSAHLPIARPTFMLDGIEIDLNSNLDEDAADTPTPICKALSAIHALHQHRGLTTFILKCPPPSNIDATHNSSTIYGVEITKALPGWEITIEPVHTAKFGDPVAEVMTIVIGCHNSRSPHPFRTMHNGAAPPCNHEISISAHLPTDESMTPLQFQYMMYEKPNNQASVYLDTIPKLIGKAYPAPPGEPLLIYDQHHPCPAMTQPPSNIGVKISNRQDPILRVRKILSNEHAFLYFHGAPRSFRNDIQHFALSQYIALTNVTSRSVPWNTAERVATFFIDNALPFLFQNQPYTLSNVIRTHLITKVPDDDAWKQAYAEDQDTNFIISRLRQTTADWNESKEIRKVDKGYWQHLRESRLMFKHGRLILFHLIGSTHKYLSLIVVPMHIRKTIFHAYHSSGTGAHMAFHKTFLAIRMRFFWPRMRTSIQTWCKGCEQCIRSRARRKESTGLVHSWPITSPFAIISVDIWKPGETKNADGYKMLLNAMCDMTQFIVSTPIKTTESTFLARTFMEHVLLKFGLCVMVVCDAGSEFRGHFQSMCEVLKLRFHPVAKRNHKAVGVERFHKFLNHAQKIGTEERGTSGAFVEIGMTTAYAWNASCIDGTEIVRSIPAIGRPLKYPLDIQMCSPPPVIDTPSDSVAKYLRYVDGDAEFARKLTQWLIDDRRAMHRERVNEDRHLVTYEPGDVVMGKIAVQSNSIRGIVGKLVFQTRGPFVIVKKTQGSSYIVRPYGTETGTTQKFQTEDLYLLPKEILPCEHLDLPDMRYMNFDFAPTNHPFGKAFDITGYNNAWYNDKPPSKPPEFLPKALIPLPDLDFTKTNANPPTRTQTDTYTQEVPTVSEDQTDDRHHNATTQHLLAFQQDLQLSTDKLFFIQFTPTNTLRPKWYLVQVQMDQHSAGDAPGTYFCTFFQKHIRDLQLPDNMSRWWADWRELKWTSEDSYEYGKRILFQPRNKPDPRKYGKFGLDIKLMEADRILAGPFDFLAKTPSRAGKSFVSNEAWAELGRRCRSTSLTPPLLSQSTRNMINLASHSYARMEMRNTSQDQNEEIAPAGSLDSTALFYHSLAQFE